MPQANLRERVMGRSSLIPLKTPAFNLIDILQRTEDASIQLDALCLTFVLICQSAGIDPHDLVSRAKRQAAESNEIPNPHLEAIRDYASGEMK